MRVKLTDAGKEYFRLFDAQHATHMLDEGLGEIVACGRSGYAGMVNLMIQAPFFKYFPRDK